MSVKEDDNKATQGSTDNKEASSKPSEKGDCKKPKCDPCHPKRKPKQHVTKSLVAEVKKPEQQSLTPQLLIGGGLGIITGGLIMAGAGVYVAVATVAGIALIKLVEYTEFKTNWEAFDNQIKTFHDFEKDYPFLTPTYVGGLAASCAAYFFANEAGGVD